MMTTPDSKTGSTVKAAFGAKNRVRLIDSYFSQEEPLTRSAAWRHVYRLLLWIDQTVGLAHCYESDKCQPGKPWYGRSLAFHDWASSSLKTSPSGLVNEIDWLFRRATSDLAFEVVRKAGARAAAGAKQRAAYDDREFPKPDEDPELVAIVTQVLGSHLSSEPTREEWQILVQRIRQHLTLENKRRNLVGEGFEDVLAAIINRSPEASTIDVRVRRLLQDLPGFANYRRGDKPNKVDLAVLNRASGKRTLVTVKWSVRADREKQFVQEYTEYVRAESDRKPFDYVFVTNEFDPARLRRACELLSSNAYTFANVVHINTDALKATYGATNEASTKAVLEYIASGRLIDLNKWLGLLVA